MKIHLIGIGGIGVSALAQYYLNKGEKISGSDLEENEITQILREKGAEVFVGSQKKENLPQDAELVVHSPAVGEENEELAEARRRGVITASYPQALGKITETTPTIAVCGTHGKSTTVSLLGATKESAGEDPSVIVGTKVPQFGNINFRQGKGRYLVIEADEYDKSFLNYKPENIILTNIEEDHLDCYGNLENIIETFREFTSHLPSFGKLIYNGKDKNSLKAIENLPVNKVDFQRLPAKTKEKIKKSLLLKGKHNLENALAVFTLCRELGIPEEKILQGIGSYLGSWRRCEVIKKEPITIISDYGHHPTEILRTMEGAREEYPGKTIKLIFQPHQYQRTYYLYDKFIKSLREVKDRELANEIILTDIFDVAGRENKEIKDKISAEKLARDVKRDKITYEPFFSVVKRVKGESNRGDILIFMGAGTIYKLPYQF